MQHAAKVGRREVGNIFRYVRNDFERLVDSGKRQQDLGGYIDDLVQIYAAPIQLSVRDSQRTYACKAPIVALIDPSVSGRSRQIASALHNGSNGLSDIMPFPKTFDRPDFIRIFDMFYGAGYWERELESYPGTDRESIVVAVMIGSATGVVAAAA
jgi:hypothetical protein